MPIATPLRRAAALLTFCGAIFSAACVQAAKPALGFDAWSEALVADWVRQSAEQASTSPYFGAEEQAMLERELPPDAPDRQARRHALARGGLDQLAGHDLAALTPAPQTAADLLRWSLSHALAGDPCQDHHIAFAQTGGAQVRLVNFLAEQTQALGPREVARIEGEMHRLLREMGRQDGTVQQTGPAPLDVFDVLDVQSEAVPRWVQEKSA